MRIYYLNAEYEPGKHRIIKVWSERFFTPKPEDSPKTAINAPYSVLEIDEAYNSPLYYDVARYATEGKYYVGGDGNLYEVEGWEPPMEVV